MAPEHANDAGSADQTHTEPDLWDFRLNMIAGVIAVGILLLSLQGLWNERQEAWREAELTSRNLLTTLTRSIGGNIASIDLSLKGAIEAYRLEEFEKLPPEVRHRVLFDRAVAATFTGTILLLDNSGNMIADGGSVLAPRHLNFAGDEFFKGHQEIPFGGLYVSRPYISKIRPSALSIALSRRLPHRTGEFAGVVAAEISLSDIYDLFQDLNIGRGGSMSLFRTDGTLLMRVPYASAEIGRDLSDTANFKRFLREGSGSFEGVAAINGGGRFYTFSRIDDLPLILVASQSTDDILAPWWRRALVLAVVTGVLCLAVARLMFMFRRELRRRTRAEKELARLARSDGLTGLPNRRAFDESFEREWRHAVRTGTSLSLLFIDVDLFKGYNDRYGHAKGDDALCAVAAAIGQSVRRPRDFAARYGGEEFVVLLPEANEAAARTVAETIREAVLQRRIEHGRSGHGVVTVSIGIGMAQPRSGMDGTTLLNSADAALYNAKASGRNCTRVFGEQQPPLAGRSGARTGA